MVDCGYRPASGKRPKNSTSSSRVLAPPSDSEASQREQRRYDKLLKEERDLQADLSALEREGDFVRTEVARAANPVGLGRAVAAFAYLTAVGIVSPIVILALQPVLSTLSRIVLVGFFTTGLIALWWYLSWAVRRLAKPSTLQVPDEQTTG